MREVFYAKKRLYLFDQKQRVLKFYSFKTFVLFTMGYILFTF